ncbi:MAG: hypothetical protein RR341_05855, partial [Bacteroidales bacterium]
TILYFHPWEFTDLKSVKRKYRLSPLITNNSGDEMLSKLENVINHQKEKGTLFFTISGFLKTLDSPAKP